VAAGVGLWWWTGSGTSLATALARAAQYLPPGQQLESRDVTGSLRGGGRIGWLRWSSPAMSVEVSDLTLGWSLAPLLQRRLELGDVHASRVQITPGTTNRAKTDEPLQPPAELVLPLQVGLAFKVDQIDWAGPPAVQVLGLAGDYRFDGQSHRLNVASVEVAQGRYTAQATVQAHAPLGLQARVDGTVQASVPGGGAPQQVDAHATLEGTLATAAAQLQLKAQLRPAGGAVSAPASAPVASSARPAPGKTANRPNRSLPPQPAEPMQADLAASLAPWQTQPLQSATATVRALDLAALWPQAPATQLHGTVTAGPAVTVMAR
jgi:translocation and assembly module TamB